MRHLLAIIAFVFSTSLFAAADDECLKSSARTEPCPRLLYKAQKIEDVNGVVSKKVVCICLEDFQPLFSNPQDELERSMMDMEVRQLEADTGMTKEALIKLIRS